MERPTCASTEPDWEDLYEYSKDLLDYVKHLEAQHERDQAEREQLLGRIKELEAALVQCVDAFEFTRQYVGYDMLPAIDGWSWFDAVNAARSALTPVHGS